MVVVELRNVKFLAAHVVQCHAELGYYIFLYVIHVFMLQLALFTQLFSWQRLQACELNAQFAGVHNAVVVPSLFVHTSYIACMAQTRIDPQH